MAKTRIKRRTFNRGLLLASAGLGLYTLAACNKKSPSTQTAASSPAPSATDVSNLVAGIDYRVLQRPVATDAPKGKVALLEFFGYWCPHCKDLAHEVLEWHKQAPKEIVLELVPVNFGSPAHDALQRLFYALRDINKLDAMHLKVFHAVHNQRLPLGTREGILDWAQKQPELKDTKFEQAYDSFSMQQHINRAQQLLNAYQVDGVPSFGVNGAYYVDGTMAKSLTRALYIAEKLAVEAAQKAS